MKWIIVRVSENLILKDAEMKKNLHDKLQRGAYFDVRGLNSRTIWETQLNLWVDE